jgi:outer membrane protein insertion porin family
MALVGRHVPLWLRVLMDGLALSIALVAAPALAQNGPDAQPRNLAPTATQPLPSLTPPPSTPQENVVDIIIKGNHTITRDKVLGTIATRINHPFDQATFEKDVRKLSAKNWFVHVHPLPREHVPGGVVITLEVVERPTLEAVQFLGNKRVKERILRKEAGLKKGDPFDIYAIQDGQRKIESYYQGKAFNDVKVSILEGTKPGDRKAVYLINEGVIQKFHKVTFVGNSYSIAPDGRLKGLVQSRTPIFWFFKGQVDRKKIDEDDEKLLDYYRALGFFNAHVGHDYEYNDAEDRVDLTFYIVEGKRYKVRNISYIGNKVFPEEALNYNQKLKGGDSFDRNRMNSDIGTIKDIYGSTGYVFCEAVCEPVFDEEPGVLDLVYKINEGSLYRIGDINIQIKGDNAHTRYATVLNRLSMRPGDIADIRAFRSSERRLKASALYNTDPSKGELPRIVFSPPDAEDGGDGSNGAKKRSTAKRSGNPDSFRGQSPDDVPAQARPTAPFLTPTAPAPNNQNVPAGSNPGVGVGPSTPSVRGQSPDGGYGGRAVNPVAPPAQPYTVNQGTPPTGPPASGPYYPPAGGAGQPEPINPGAPAYGAPPLLPPPGDFYAPPLDPNSAPRLPVTVVTQEGQTGKFMFGAGINSNAGLIGSIILDEQNFDWQRLPTSWEDFRSGRAFRGSGQKFRIEAAPGTQVSRYMINFQEPYLFDTPVGLGLSGFYFNRFYRDWTEQRAGGRAALLYQFTPDLSGNFAVQAQDIRISQPRVTTVPDLNAVLGHTQLYSFKGQLAHDTRDNTFLATEGHYLEADVEYDIGSFQFPRFTANARQHLLLRERPDSTGRHTLSFYSTFGISGADTPIYERFFAGGFGTLRGFQFRGASPQINTVEVGGILETINSIEYMFPITADDMLKAVTFVDFGTVSYTDTIIWRDFRVAPGFGLRVTIPMISQAPIAFDFAFPVQYAPNDIRQVFSFFVGVGH